MEIRHAEPADYPIRAASKSRCHRQPLQPMGRSVLLLGKGNLEIFRRKYGRWRDQRSTDPGLLYPAATAMDAVHICKPDFVSGDGL